MAKSIACAVFVIGVLTNVASAEETPREGRSASCSNVALVCAVMKDGTVQPTSECDAPKAGVARVLSGDCYDED